MRGLGKREVDMGRQLGGGKEMAETPLHAITSGRPYRFPMGICPSHCSTQIGRQLESLPASVSASILGSWREAGLRLRRPTQDTTSCNQRGALPSGSFLPASVESRGDSSLEGSIFCSRRSGRV